MLLILVILAFVPITIDPVKLNIPGGSFSLAASLKPDLKAPQASVRAVMEKFDFGVGIQAGE